MSRWGRMCLWGALVVALLSPLSAGAEVISPSEDEAIPFNAQPVTLTGSVPYFLDGNRVEVYIIGEVGDFCSGTVIDVDQWSCTLPLTVHLAAGTQTFEVIEEGAEPTESARTVTIGPSALAITSATFTSPTTLTVRGTRDATGSSGVPYDAQATILLPFSDNARVTVPCESVGDDEFTCMYEFDTAHPAGTLTDVTISEIWAERTVETRGPQSVRFPGTATGPVGPPSPGGPSSGGASPPAVSAGGAIPVTPIPLASLLSPAPPGTVPSTPAPAPASTDDRPATHDAAAPTLPTQAGDALRLLLLAAIAFAILAMIGPHGLAYASDQVRRRADWGTPGTGRPRLGGPPDGSAPVGDATAAMTLAALAAHGGDKDRGDGTTNARRFGLGWGDRSWTWQLAGWKQIDRVSRHTPMTTARRLPLVARLGADANYLRAAFGALWLLLPLCGLALGVVAASSSGALPVAPSTALTAVLIVLAIIDATSGAVAVLAFTAAVLLGGGLSADGIDTLDGIRGLLGLAALWFAIPLIAAAARPFRRLSEPDHVYDWDRLGDAVIAAFVGSLAVYAIVAGFGDLVGRAAAVADHAVALALLAGGVIAARVALEEIIMIGYPARLRAVQHADPLTKPTRLHQARGIVVRGLLVALFASAAIGHCWQLWVGVALYAVPQLFTLVEDHLPNLPRLHRTIPRGVVELFVMLIVGLLLARIIDSTFEGETTRALRDGFLLLACPGFILAALGILGRESTPPPWTWPRQLAGAVLVVATVVLVVVLA